jgi:hypothetical protein
MRARVPLCAKKRLHRLREVLDGADCEFAHPQQPPVFGCGPLAGPFGFLGFWVGSSS